MIGGSGKEMTGVAAILVAAGRGMRAGDGVPKQYRPIAGRPMLRHSLETLLGVPRIDRVLAVIHPDDAALYADAIANLPDDHVRRLLPAVHGGEDRQASVLRGLEALETLGGIDVVLIHDAARPFLPADVAERAIDAAAATGAAVPTVPVADTIKRCDSTGRVAQTLDRASLHAAQTPQSFRFEVILDAHRKAAGLPQRFTDDAAVAEWAGLPVTVFAGDPDNRKLTHAADFARPTAPLPLVGRSGLGYDVHAFGPGDHIMLGGIRIPHDQGVVAHSDGDVVLHALTDALLGVIADGDIGVHFPPSDPQWRNASSDRFLADAVRRVTARGGRIDHLDIVVLCERPRIGPHRDAIRARIAEIVDIKVNAVSIKATTSEGMGFIGRREGIAAHAVASVRLPPEEDENDG